MIPARGSGATSSQTGLQTPTALSYEYKLYPDHFVAIFPFHSCFFKKEEKACKSSDHAQSNAGIYTTIWRSVKKVIWRLRKIHHAAPHAANHLYGYSYR